ncbi:hemagglutinin repeat-containing protein [Xanthomonas sp. 3498]|uniref:hemagglutinin repeat-containing protein n=1 Tax=Xanthomonas sp. 3498 TaxID=2663863 RepID=UPI00160AA885|nr:hemagglutinin repeat-containing protein [Xanthomonas sp. 3498]MBB5877728.1 hypothetical protein [Xanthomonas sp. 3498]
MRSGVSAGNNLLLQAGRDLSLTGTTVQADNSAALLAGNNLTLQPTAARRVQADAWWRWHQPDLRQQPVKEGTTSGTAAARRAETLKQYASPLTSK